MTKTLCALLLAMLGAATAVAQNLPSLLLDRNIQSTFSITAYDSAAHEWGIAVATNNLYVGNATVYIEPGVGAFSVIAETEPAYAINGFSQLRKGKSIKEAIQYTRNTDEDSLLRQVAGIDARGNRFAFTGGALKYWNGLAAHRIGANYIVMGNQLADSVLAHMATTFEAATGSLAERLLKSLVAGQQAGGQINGKQSAALVVKGTNNEWYNQIDLRVDHALQPFDDLQRLLNYHYGRIRVNQALYAIGKGNRQRGEAVLLEAQQLVNGWNGLYGKLAKAWILLGKEDKAVAIIQQALAENPSWKVNLPAFYCLYHHAAIRELLQPDLFTVQQWNNAVEFLAGINRSQEAIKLAREVTQRFPNASYTRYLLGKLLHKAGQRNEARQQLAHAIRLDADNIEARLLLQQL